MEFDAFLSHNSADKPSVRELHRQLTGAGLHVWLDETHLRPGMPWQEGLEAGILASAAVLVCLGASGVGPWENEEMQAAINLATRERRPVIPVLLPGAPDRPAISLFLGNRTWVDLRTGLDAAGIARLVWGITGTRPEGQSGTGRETGADPSAAPVPAGDDAGPPGAQPLAGPSGRRPDPRRAALERALAQLVSQYEAALQQSVNSPDAVTAVQAAQQAEAIERRIDDLRQRLDRLTGPGA